jgi:hypothetical protein
MKTRYHTKDGLAVYDLDPLAAELWVIAGPDDLDEVAIDTDDIPEGCRWVDSNEWAAIQSLARHHYVPHHEIVRAVRDARGQTDRVEQRALALLHERGHMAGLTCDQQREVEWDVCKECSFLEAMRANQRIV